MADTMSDETNQTVNHTGDESDAAADDAQSRRERSRIGFPYGDLNDAYDIASRLHRSYGLSCSIDQLAAALNQTTTSGALRTKVATAKTFGVLDLARKQVSLTALGTRLVAPDTEAQARVEAFTNVPLYSAIFSRFQGTRLPGDNGLEHEMKQLGVAEKQTARARQAFQRSAQQAGFFHQGSDRLVMPPAASMNGSAVRAADAEPIVDQRPVTSTVAARPSSIVATKDALDEMHPLIAGLIRMLPAENEPFPARKRKQWLAAARVNLALIWGAEDEDVEDDTPSPHLSATGVR